MEDLLPEELTIDILSRLPVKAIIYCKCVCKKWRNIVIDSSFVELHLSGSPTGLIIHHKTKWNDPGILEWVEIEDKDDYHLLQHDPLMSLRLNLAPILQKSVIDVVGSVNGLICLWQNLPNHDNIYVCNPVTREYMTPLPRQKQYYREDYSLIIYGFGVSSMIREYKVIRINYESSESEAEVYTLGTCQWRSVGRAPYELYVSNDGLFLNDHFHWIICDENAPEKLCTFDFNKETFQLFSSPPVEAIQGSRRHLENLAILKDCLCKMDSYDFEYTIWMMKEYGIKGSWHKEIVINQAINRYLDWPMWKPSNLIDGSKDGSILTICEFKLWAYYPKNKIIQDTGLFTFSSSSTVSGMAYRPSFLKLRDFGLERVHMF